MILIGQIGERVDLGEVGAEGMQRGVQVTATEYSLRDRVNMFRLARRIERYATRKGLQLPW